MDPLPRGSLNDLALELKAAVHSQDVVNGGHDGVAAVLSRLLAAHTQVAAALARQHPPAGADGDGEEEMRAAHAQRQAALDTLYAGLDVTIRQMRDTLDLCNNLLQSTPPLGGDPRHAVAFAHRLRFSFAPLGATPGLPSAPPAPQVWDMRASTLVQLARAQREADAERAAAAAAAAVAAAPAPAPAPPDGAGAEAAALWASGAAIPEGWQPGDPIPQEFLAAMIAAGGGGGVAAPAAPAPAPAEASPAAAPAARAESLPRPAPGAAFGLALNADLDLGEEVAEEWSSEAYSDD